jgi:hypothetical protein
VVAVAEFDQQPRHAFRLGFGHVAEIRLRKIFGSSKSINKICATENSTRTSGQISWAR